jgi:glycine oxidase
MGRATVIVAGAGALGLSTALALADAGCAVTVCDPEADANASSVAAGMLAPVFETVLDTQGSDDLALLLAARNLWPAAAARAGVELDRAGAVAVGSPDWLAGVGARMSALGLHGTELGERTLAQLAPGLTIKAGLMTREDWRIEPRQALHALRAAALAAGVAFRPEAVEGRGGADWLIAATGAGRALAPELARLIPVKGHILRVDKPPSIAVSLRAAGVYAVPAQGGLAVGATMEPGVDDPAVDPAKGTLLREAGTRLFPELAQARARLFAGIRAATPDGLPMVGPSAEPGVLVAAGARRNGWLLAPLVAQLIVACVTGRDPGPYAARLDPRRFEETAP